MYFKDIDWINGWTEETARTYCEDYILSRPSVEALEDVPNVDIEGAIELCIEDIYVSDKYQTISKFNKTCFKNQCISSKRCGSAIPCIKNTYPRKQLVWLK